MAEKTFTPPNHPNLTLPVMTLKGNPYMKVAYRLQWFVEDVKRYTIKSEPLVQTDTMARVRVTVSIFDDNGNVIRVAESTKTETKADFADFYEKAETGALGRALASLGYGTAQAAADLDEGDRIVDAPLSVPVGVSPVSLAFNPIPQSALSSSDSPKKPSSFRKQKTVGASPETPPAAAPVATAVGSDSEWT